MIRRRDERGSLAPAMPIIAMMLLMLAGLGIDGSRQLNSRGEAVAYAEEAARAGAQAVDLDKLDLTLDEPEALRRVADYCTAVLKQPTVTDCHIVGGPQEVSDSDHRRLVIEVSVSTKVKTTLLGLAGVHELKASATAKARPYEGIDNPVNEP